MHRLTLWILCFALFASLTTQAQNKMRPIEDLINKDDPAWPLVKEWISKAKNKVEVLPCNKAQATEALYQIQVTTRSPMGAIVCETGGILIDDGWIRILGSGSKKLNRTLPGWNMQKTIKEYGYPTPYILIADEAAGGFYALNGSGLGADLGKIYYLSPDNLEWEPLGLSYTDFLLFCFDHDLNEFYKGMRWKDWRKDVAAIPGDKAFTFYPFLWTKEGKDINKATRKAVPVEESWSLAMDFRKQLGIK